MQKIFFLTILLSTAVIYSSDERAQRHVQILRQNYATLFPVAQTNANGQIVAYYFHLEGKTRALVSKNVGATVTYERPYISKENPMEIFNEEEELNQFAYQGFLEVYEKYVAEKIAVKLPLAEKN